MKKKALLLLPLVLTVVSVTSLAQSTDAQWNTPGVGNPLIPGYFADPTIRKFGDTYYIYSTTDGTIHGPGHHSILVDGDDYYIVYHRHNNPHSIHGFHRQVCIDKMVFDANGDIKPITPTHEGVVPASLVTAGKAQLSQSGTGSLGHGFVDLQ